MAIPRKQIGWSNESNLLWQISSQMEKLTGIAFNSGGGGGGVTQIIPGTGVTISPSGGTGAVTINASGGGAVVKTLSEITKDINDNVLVPGQHYIITGVNPTLYGGTTIMLHAISTNQI